MEYNQGDINKIAATLQLQAGQVAATASLLAKDATIPFIARYRKEATGSLDEVAIGAIKDQLKLTVELLKRKVSILKSLAEQEKLTPELQKKVQEQGSLSALEDLYLPFRPKVRTRASRAREYGLEPLAKSIMRQDAQTDPLKLAEKYLNDQVATLAAALSGAQDIIAEIVSEDARARSQMRQLFERKARIYAQVAKQKEQEGVKYRDYYDWEMQVSSVPSHSYLAVMRGQKEGFLRVSISPDAQDAAGLLKRIFMRNNSALANLVSLAVEDGYKRLLAPAMETEFRARLKLAADKTAIDIFARNLRELLLAPPLGPQAVLALDPGFRSGCKLVCLNRQGSLLYNDTIYPHSGRAGREQAGKEVLRLCSKYQVEAIAIGNGTAGRETKSFIAELDFKGGAPQVVLVNESGASIYSASAVARAEFPDYDITVRGAVSIGRRLVDPLAELVKIDPKSIGVGQYQHDLHPASLKESLEETVESCVNLVGVQVNTASCQLLQHVSGLGPQLAANIVAYREENGPFKARPELKKVARLGPKAFEQAIGFLRIDGGKNPLDASAVHPESYAIVKRMAQDLQLTAAELIGNKPALAQLDLERYVSAKVGLPTLRDILAELLQPNRDPRAKFTEFSFQEGVCSLQDLSDGMTLPGIITNVTAFGAFVDIGVHQDGLIHISKLSKTKFVKDPNLLVRVHQQVQVEVVGVDIPRKRISLALLAG